MSARALWALAAVAALSGCASTPVFEGGRAWNEGWREGKVEKVGAASELGYRQSYDCRYREGGAGREAQGRFAVVAVQNMGKHRHVVAPVESGKEPAVGSEVLVNWRGCESPIARSGK
jgi:hypothetical protein